MRNLTPKPAGAAVAKLLGDRKLAKAIYRKPSSNGCTFGPVGLYLSADGYGRTVAASPCVCGGPLNFDALAIYSDGNSKPVLDHRDCAIRGFQWVQARMAEDDRMAQVKPEPEPTEEIAA